MRPSGLQALAAASLLACGSNSLELLEKRVGSPPAVLGFPIWRKDAAQVFPAPAAERRDTANVALSNLGSAYFANISIGTPPQDISLRIDTGSSDLWVNVKSSSVCSSRRNRCDEYGTYDSSSSSSYKLISSNFNVSYADGTSVSGDYASETVDIGSQSLTGLQFGVGLDSQAQSGILGVGYPANEAQAHKNGGQPYPNLPQALVNSKVIQSSTYSLWLDDLKSSTGSILFGGVDSAKYTGALETLPIQQEQGEFAEFIITLTGLSLSQNGRNLINNASSLPTTALLDSGSSLTYLPGDLVNEIYSALNIQFSESAGTGTCSCGLAQADITLNLTFTKPSISIAIDELVLNPLTDLSTQEEGPVKRQQFPGGGGSQQSQCLFGIAPLQQGNMVVLGDTFLRSAYVVYDLANNQISIAQTDFNSTNSDIKEIGTGKGSVPGASFVPSVVEASVSETGGARIATPSVTSDASDLFINPLTILISIFASAMRIF